MTAERSDCIESRKENRKRMVTKGKWSPMGISLQSSMRYLSSSHHRRRLCPPGRRSVEACCPEDGGLYACSLYLYSQSSMNRSARREQRLTLRSADINLPSAASGYDEEDSKLMKGANGLYKCG